MLSGRLPVSDSEMLPKSPTKVDPELPPPTKPALPPKPQFEDKRDTSCPQKRDIVVEFNGGNRAKIRTTEGQDALQPGQAAITKGWFELNCFKQLA